MIRVDQNPLLTISDVKPTFDFMEVKGVFNAGAVKFRDEFILLVRIAEEVISEQNNILKVPVVSLGELEVVEFDINDGKYDYSDSRVIRYLNSNKTAYLTTISHIRIARSKDGINFIVDDKPFIWPKTSEEDWGVEDPRVINIDNLYYINYTAVSKFGAATKLQVTEDFISLEDKGVIFAPENKDVCLINEKVGDYYYAYHRPVPKAFGEPDIWTARSKDLIHWGQHKHFLGVSQDSNWENGRIGGGAPSLKTDQGWLHIYHAADLNNRYCLGAFLTKLDDPTTLIAKTNNPLLEPIADYEVNGFFGNVVFTCGVIKHEEVAHIYYGAADDKICLAKIDISDILEMMEETK